MKDKALLVCKNVLERFTKEELSKFHGEQRKIMEDLLKNMIADIFMYIDLKTKGLKDFPPEMAKKLEKKIVNIIKFYKRFRKDPQFIKELMKQSRKTPGGLKYNDIMEIYRKFKAK